MMKLIELRQKYADEIKSAFLSSGNESLIFQAQNALLDMDLILSDVLKKDRTWILFHRDFEVDSASVKKIETAAAKRRTGLPVAYITNKKDFYGQPFYVSEDVLIPKPDTELLVDLAVEALIDKYRAGENKNGSFVPLVCDMCTGSGCVGISIFKELIRRREADENLPEMTFVDLSAKALDVAKANAGALIKEEYAQKLRFIQTNLFDDIPYVFDLIAANPPYVPHFQALSLLEDGRNEPLLALDGDVNNFGDYSDTDDGLSIIRRLVPQCYSHLCYNGVLVMETGEYNAEETAELFRKEGFRNVRIELDMTEKMRDVIGIK